MVTYFIAEMVFDQTKYRPVEHLVEMNNYVMHRKTVI